MEILGKIDVRKVILNSSDDCSYILRSEDFKVESIGYAPCSNNFFGNTRITVSPDEDEAIVTYKSTSVLISENDNGLKNYNIKIINNENIVSVEYLESNKYISLSDRYPGKNISIKNILGKFKINVF